MRSLPSDLEGNFSIFSDEEVPSFNNRVWKLKRVLKSWISIHKEHTSIKVISAIRTSVFTCIKFFSWTDSPTFCTIYTIRKEENMTTRRKEILFFKKRKKRIKLLNTFWNDTKQCPKVFATSILVMESCGYFYLCKGGFLKYFIANPIDKWGKILLKPYWCF